MHVEAAFLSPTLYGGAGCCCVQLFGLGNLSWGEESRVWEYLADLKLLLFCLCCHLITPSKMSHLPPPPKILLRKGKGALDVKQYHCGSWTVSMVPTWFPGYLTSLFLRWELRWSKYTLNKKRRGNHVELSSWRSCRASPALTSLEEWMIGREALLRRLKPRALWQVSLWVVKM